MAAIDPQARPSADDQTHYPLSRLLTFRLSKLQARLNAQAAHLLAEGSGLTLIQWRLLVLVNEFGTCTTAEIVRRFSFDKGLLSRSLKLLVERNLVTIAADEKDSRRKRLSLTEDGGRVIRQTRPVMERRQAHLLREFTEAEKDMLFMFLDRLDEASRRKDFA